jgi:hypothetical protein
MSIAIKFKMNREKILSLAAHNPYISMQKFHRVEALSALALIDDLLQWDLRIL